MDYNLNNDNIEYLKFYGKTMIKIGLCGLGTVGKSFFDHLNVHKKRIASNIDQDFKLLAIADRSIEKKINNKDFILTKNPIEVAENPDIDIVVELIGDIDTSLELVTKSIKNNKQIITANKALIAKHGDEIFSQAKQNDVFIGFEASVAGAIPIIQTILKNFSNEKITSIVGIINGTSNFILDQMTNSNCEFSLALKEAQKLGYAEADPSFDINGQDAAHKISILSALAFKIKSPLDKTHIEGIEKITPMDIKHASELGYIIKHVGITEFINNSVVSRVHPVLVSDKDIFSNTPNVMNSIIVEGDRFGKTMLYGHGAGGDATASAVVADLISAINHKSNVDTSFSQMVHSSVIQDYEIMDIDDVVSQYYMRIFADDKPGVMAEITNKLAEQKISIEAVTQHEPNNNNSPIPIVMITDRVDGEHIKSAIKNIEAMPHIREKVYSIRILKNE